MLLLIVRSAEERGIGLNKLEELKQDMVQLIECALENAGMGNVKIDPQEEVNALVIAAQDEVWSIVDKVLKNPEVYQIWYSDMQNKIMVESHDADVPDAFGDDVKEAFLIMIKTMEKKNV